ncbi:MAG: hypothetical protein LBJ48_06570 [Coriobacteriales bacterium]|nr:hypothetical protein [Coriobacteriales bacterium]
MRKPKSKVLGSLLAISVSGAIGMTVYSLYPAFTLWFIFECEFMLSMLLMFGIMFVSVAIPFIPAAISTSFGIPKNYVLALACALLMGLPVTGVQISNWSLYASPIEGGTGWEAFFCIVFPGMVFIVVTFLNMAGIGNTTASASRVKKDKKDVPPLSPEMIYFRKHGRKYKIWSIVNTCLLFFTILPILAIIQSNKAQKATDKKTHDRHIKTALIFNLCTYVIFILGLFLVAIVESKGFTVM